MSNTQSPSSFFNQQGQQFTEQNPSGPAQTPVTNQTTDAPSSFYKGNNENPNGFVTSPTYIQTIVPLAHYFLTGLNTDGSWDRAQPAFTDISGVAAAGQIPSTLNPTTISGNATVTGNLAVGSATPFSEPFSVHYGTNVNLLSYYSSGAIGFQATNDAGNANIPLSFTASEVIFNCGATGVVPIGDNVVPLGGAGARWSNIYGVNVIASVVNAVSEYALNGLQFAILNGTATQISETTGGTHDYTWWDLSGNITECIAGSWFVKNLAQTTTYAAINSTGLGIGKAPSYGVDVAGDVNINAGQMYRVNGSQIAFSNIAGVVASAQLPVATGSAYGAVIASAAPAHEWCIGISSGILQYSQPAASDLSNGTTGNAGGPVVLQTSATIITPVIAQIIPSGGTLLLSASIGGSNIGIGQANVSGGQLTVAGGASGSQVWKTAAAASGSIIFPAGTVDFSSTGGASQVVKQTSAGAMFTVGQLAASDISGLAASATTDTTNASNISSGTLATARLSSSMQTAAITFVIDGAGSALTTGMKGYLEIPFACTITQVTQLADQSGSVVCDIWKTTYANFDAGTTHPVSADKITSSTPPTISSAKKSSDSTLSGWTTSISAGDVLAFNINSATTITRVTVTLYVTKS